MREMTAVNKPYKHCKVAIAIDYMCGDTYQVIKERHGCGSYMTITRAVHQFGIKRPPKRTRRITGRERIEKFAELNGTEIDWTLNRKAAVERFGHTCAICGKECDESDKSWGTYGPDYPTLDHIKPLSKGGSHTWDNAQILCGWCNAVVKKDAEVIA